MKISSAARESFKSTAGRKMKDACVRYEWIFLAERIPRIPNLNSNTSTYKYNPLEGAQLTVCQNSVIVILWKDFLSCKLLHNTTNYT